MEQGTEEALIQKAIDFACDAPVPSDRRGRAVHGEKLARYVLKLVEDPAYFYQMVEWPREYQPGFDIVFLAYARADVQAATARPGIRDLGRLEPWDVGEPTHCLLVEAKCTKKTGSIRTYLRYNRRRGCRQMSRAWIKAAIASCKPQWLGSLVDRHFRAGTLRRMLIVKLGGSSGFRFWREEDFQRLGLDDD